MRRLSRISRRSGTHVRRLLVVSALFGIDQAAGSTIFPIGAVYSNWTDESIVLDVTNPPPREVVKFIALAGYNKFDGTVLAGFLMAAADITTADTRFQRLRSARAHSTRSAIWITKAMTTAPSWRRHKILFSPRFSLTQCFPGLMNCVFAPRFNRRNTNLQGCLRASGTCDQQFHRLSGSPCH